MANVCVTFGALARLLPSWDENTTVNSVHQAVYAIYYNVALPDKYCLEINGVELNEMHLTPYRGATTQASPPDYVTLYIKALSSETLAADEQPIDNSFALWEEYHQRTSSAQHPSEHKVQSPAIEETNEYVGDEEKQLVFARDVQKMKRFRYISDKEITMLSGHKAIRRANEQLHHGAVHPLLRFPRFLLDLPEWNFMYLIVALVIDVLRDGHRYLWLERKHGFIVDDRWLKFQCDSKMLPDVFVADKFATLRYQVENPVETVLNKTDLTDGDKYELLIRPLILVHLENRELLKTSLAPRLFWSSDGISEQEADFDAFSVTEEELGSPKLAVVSRQGTRIYKETMCLSSPLLSPKVKVKSVSNNNDSPTQSTPKKKRMSNKIKDQQHQATMTTERNEMNCLPFIYSSSSNCHDNLAGIHEN